ncbi:transposase [Xanthomonas sacchari]|uniref:transposase n=1 Tax=Xanthomonas sacchari TaxID=56458 RepID=UPI001FC92343|nr:transposase [Xanthomonas sacchari]
MLEHRRAAQPDQSATRGRVEDAERIRRAPDRQGTARVEHPFRVIKQQFGYQKVRYRGLAKNDGQLNVLFALSNLWMARRQLLAMTGKVRPRTG